METYISTQLHETHITIFFRQFCSAIIRVKYRYYVKLHTNTFQGYYMENEYSAAKDNTNDQPMENID